MSLISDNEASGLPYLYISTMTFSPRIESTADNWNNNVHIPDLMHAGFLDAVRYRTIEGILRTCHIYEVPNIEILTTNAYVRIEKPPSDVLGGISNYSVSLYRHLLTARSIQTDEERVFDRQHTRYLATVKMDVAPDFSEELISWYREEHLPMLLDVKGIVSVKLCRRVGYHPVFRSFDPEWVFIYAMQSLEPLSHTSLESLATPRLQLQIRRQFMDLRFSVLERIFPDYQI